MDKTFIIVPVKMEALVVDEHSYKNTPLKDLSLDYESIANSRLSDDMEDGNFNTKTKLLEIGVHLHWAIPAALRHGITHNQEIAYAPAPNRWMVIRTQNLEGQLVHKEWIIESDFIDEQDGSSPWVIHEAGILRDTRIGRSIEFTAWESESGTPSEPLTGLGPGNASFGAYYGSCRDVFGFHDALEDVDNGTLSYFVVGWYSSSELDPLYPKVADEIWQNQRSELLKGQKEPEELWQKRILDLENSWKLPDETDTFPKRILCHCSINKIRWNKDNGPSNDILNAAVNVAVGNTSVEAMSARIARQTGAAEKILSAFQYDLLKDVSGLVEIQDKVHASQFNDAEGGTLWEIQKSETDNPYKKEDQNNLPDFPDVSDGKLPGLVENFTDLNKAQRELDNLKRIRFSLQVEFRSTRDKIIMNSNQGESYNDFLENKRKKLITEIEKVNNSIATSKKAIESCQKSIRKLEPFIGKNDEPPHYELLEIKMPRFWQPKDPSVLLSGPGVLSSDKYQNTNDNQELLTLSCRVKGNIISGIILKDKELVEAAIGMSDLLKNKEAFSLDVRHSLTEGLRDIIELVYLESLLFDPAWARDLALAYYLEKRDDRITRTSKWVEDLYTQIEKFLDGDIEKIITDENIIGFQPAEGDPHSPPGSKLAKKALFNDLAVCQWKEQPWTPFFMLWNVQWLPAYQKQKEHWIYKPENYVFPDAYDYVKAAEFKPADSKQMYILSGKTFLSDAVSKQLRSRLKGYNKLAELNFLAQALDGFNDALLMKKQAVQLPLLQYDANDNLVVDQSDDSYLNTNDYFLPDTSEESPFFPIRAGRIKINRLWVTDTFGQIQKIVDLQEEDINSKAVRDIAEDLFDEDDYINLPPRIIQPTRLLFRWMAKDDEETLKETDSNPETSPICGWIMPNHLDQQLMVFEASGKIAGTLGSDLTGALVWSGPPGSINSQGIDADIEDEELRNFIQGIQQAGDLKKLLKLMELVSDSIDAPGAKQDSGMAVLFGQPLALVKSTLRLELFGLPAFPQGWQQGWTAQTANKPTGLEGYHFPVRLGDLRKHRDGLAGYFTKANGQEINYSQMHLCFGASDSLKSKYFTTEDMELSFREDDEVEIVTLLMDPRGGVNASSGILPTKFIEIPSGFVRDAMEHMEMNFLVAPIIGDYNSPAIPLAKDSRKKWEWVSQETAGVWSEPDGEIADRSNKPKNDFKAQQIHEGYLSLKLKKTDEPEEKS